MKQASCIMGDFEERFVESSYGLPLYSGHCVFILQMKVRGISIFTMIDEHNNSVDNILMISPETRDRSRSMLDKH